MAFYCWRLLSLASLCANLTTAKMAGVMPDILKRGLTH